ncbi:MAG: hypothetical protein EOP88_07075 [Verrucomicrobiaceae bacterium]|nr:MAG: hypothetical protein EOP88_07075 [Verrucomicrobiaceae bacterium]
MTASASTARQGDGRLWAISLGLSLLLNGAVLVAVGLVSLRSEILRRTRPAPVVPAETATTLTIFPELVAAEPTAAPSVAVEVAPAPVEKPKFARTSPDQTAEAEPQTRAFIGERNTTATSDRAPDPTAPPLPSQAGVTKEYDDLETTDSDYQDGTLAGNQPARPDMPPPTEAQSAPAPIPDPAVAENQPTGEQTETPGNSDKKTSPPPAEKLLQGQNPVDVPVPKEVPDKSEIKPTPPERPKEGTAAVKPPAETPKPPAPKPSDQPGFRGNQRKSAIVGSISRTGRSALDVADSPLGRYQAVISRAVELEWQRNCVRHRDFITPGFLTVRFFVETTGKVRTVQFVGDMETGEVQKGFTLNSIRDADIPAMPPAVKRDYEKEPLELIFNFYF